MSSAATVRSTRSNRSTAQVPQTTGDTQYNVRDAALLGASSAFSKPPVKPKPQANNYTGGSNGALLAATKVGAGTTAPLPLSRNTTGGSLLSVPANHAAERTPSPSNIAAKLAAARHSPMRPPEASSATSERDVLPPPGSVVNVLARWEPPSGDSPPPPTASLVKMFEKKRPTTPVTSSAEPLPVSQKAPPPIRSPKPRRTIVLPAEPKPDAAPPAKPKPKPKPRTLSMDGGRLNSPRLSPATPTTPARQKPAQLTMVKTAALRPIPPPRKGSGQVRPMSEDLTRSAALKRQVSNAMSIMSAESDDTFVSASEEQQREPEPKQEAAGTKEKPNLPPPRRAKKATLDGTPGEDRPQSVPLPPKPRTSNTSRSPMPVSRGLTPPTRPTDSLSSTPSEETLFRSKYQRESAKQLAQHLTGESISSAIVGAALASSRVPSRGPSRGPSPGPPSVPTPPIPSRRHHHHHLPSLHHDRSPSPQKQPGKLRTTLRKEPTTSSSEDESEKYRKKGTRVMGMRKKHPNKHHEGTRKRWRDSITERERKRYEGVWAANKGLYILEPSQKHSASQQPDDPSHEVLNLVVKEIWSRSRLTDHVLEEVWDLVDTRGIGRLRREEFVVGLWLIDQRLKGRKLPLRVSDSVWDSVRGPGVKVKVKPRK